MTRADQEDRVAHAWLARFFGRCMAAYVALVARTCRISGLPINQEQVIFAIWHESNLVAAIAAWKLRRDKHPVVFSTRGFRGIVMNTMLRKPRVLNTTGCLSRRSFQAAMAATRFDSCQIGRAHV